MGSENRFKNCFYIALQKYRYMSLRARRAWQSHFSLKDGIASVATLLRNDALIMQGYIVPKWVHAKNLTVYHGVPACPVCRQAGVRQGPFNFAQGSFCGAISATETN